jgi:hypothetical protein
MELSREYSDPSAALAALLALADGRVGSALVPTQTSLGGHVVWPRLAARRRNELFVHSACQAAGLLVEWRRSPTVNRGLRGGWVDAS